MRDPIPPDSDLPVGAEVHGYQIEEVLSRGGFGRIYRAKAVSTRARHVVRRRLGGEHYEIALKEFFPTGLVSRDGAYVRRSVHPDHDMIEAEALAAYEHFRQGFVAESQFQITQALNHPAIAKGIELFVANGTEYFVQELVNGITLRRLIDRKKDSYPRISENDIRSMFLPLLEVMSLMHERDQMHRDIHPGNIMCRPDSSLVLIDFGLVGEGLGLDRRSDLSRQVGSDGYAPPEQRYQQDGVIDGRQVTFRAHGAFTDIYSAAAVLYFAVTGRRPVRSQDRASAIMLKGSDPLDRDLLMAACSQSMARGVLKGLEINPEKRPQNIDEFLEALGWDSQLRSEELHTKLVSSAQNGDVVSEAMDPPTELVETSRTGEVEEERETLKLRKRIDFGIPAAIIAFLGLLMFSVFWR